MKEWIEKEFVYWAHRCCLEYAVSYRGSSWYFAQKSSVGMSYFTQTLNAIENVDPSKFRKGASIDTRNQIVWEILEIAGIERDKAVKKLTPRLMKESAEYFDEIRYTSNGIVDSIGERALYIDWKERGKTSKIQRLTTQSTLLLVGDFKWKKPMIYGDYSNLHPILESLLQNHRDRIYWVLENFLAEEGELRSRLRVWLWLRSMYQPANFESWFVPEIPDYSSKE